MLEFLNNVKDEDKYVQFTLGGQMVKIRRFLTTSELMWLTSNYVTDYFNGVETTDGDILTDKTGKDAFNPNLALRQFHVNLAQTVAGWEGLDGDEITKLEELGVFQEMRVGCVNADVALWNAREIIEHELSVGFVVQSFLAKFSAMIPEPAELKEMIGDFSASINKVSPDRLPFIADLMDGKK